jgi:hypothetical protein
VRSRIKRRGRAYHLGERLDLAEILSAGRSGDAEIEGSLIRIDAITPLQRYGLLRTCNDAWIRLEQLDVVPFEKALVSDHATVFSRGYEPGEVVASIGHDLSRRDGSPHKAGSGNNGHVNFPQVDMRSRLPFEGSAAIGKNLDISDG